MKALMGLILTLVTITSTEVVPNYAVDYSYPYRSASPGIGYNPVPHDYQYFYHTKPQYNTFSYRPKLTSLNSGFKQINFGLTSNVLGLASNNVGIVSHNTGLVNNAGLLATYPGLDAHKTGLTSLNPSLPSYKSGLTPNYAGLMSHRPGFTSYNSGLSPTGLYSYKIPTVKVQTAPVARYLAVPLTLHRNPNHYSLPGRRQNFNYFSPTIKPYLFQGNDYNL